MIQGLNPDRRKRSFFLPKHPHQLWGPLSLLFNGDMGLPLGVKWPRYNTDQVTPSSVSLPAKETTVTHSTTALHYFQKTSH